MATILNGHHVSEERIKEIKAVSEAWAIANGVTMRASKDELDKVVCAPYALFPTVVPQSLLHQAKASMVHFSSLMHKVALDHEFLEKSLRNVIEIDDFMSRLWNIYTQVRAKGVRQPLMLGLFRNDFMMNVKEGPKDAENISGDQLELKQIEFNAIASSFAGLIQQICHLHRLTLSMAAKKFSPEQAPDNTPATGLSKGLVKAWEFYSNPKAVIIFIVSSCERNVIDQFALEIGVYYQNPSIRVRRVTLLDVGTRGTLDDNGLLTLDGDEVAVIYFRDGYTSENYTSEKEWDARLTMEMSLAIKCPSIHYQLIGAKKIQQELARTGCLERYIDDPNIVKIIRDTFAGQYSLDLGPEGDKAVEMASAEPDKFVLKPQREGGGHNLYSADISHFLVENKNSKERNAYIMMERIFPWEQKNYLIKQGVPFQLTKVINEIGVYGVFIGSTELPKDKVNFECGHMVRTKTVGTDEGGVCAGFAVLDTPFLV